MSCLNWILFNSGTILHKIIYFSWNVSRFLRFLMTLLLPVMEKRLIEASTRALHDASQSYGAMGQWWLSGLLGLTFWWVLPPPPKSFLQFWHNPTSRCRGKMKIFPSWSRPAQDVGLGFWRCLGCAGWIGKTFWFRFEPGTNTINPICAVLQLPQKYGYFWCIILSTYWVWICKFATSIWKWPNP